MGISKGGGRRKERRKKRGGGNQGEKLKKMKGKKKKDKREKIKEKEKFVCWKIWFQLDEQPTALQISDQLLSFWEDFVVSALSLDILEQLSYRNFLGKTSLSLPNQDPNYRDHHC